MKANRAVITPNITYIAKITYASFEKNIKTGNGNRTKLECIETSTRHVVHNDKPSRKRYNFTENRDP